MRGLSPYSTRFRVEIGVRCAPFAVGGRRLEYGARRSAGGWEVETARARGTEGQRGKGRMGEWVNGWIKGVASYI
jgi:hypothetical protein